MKELHYAHEQNADGPYTVFEDDDGHRYVISDVLLAAIPQQPGVVNPDALRAKLNLAEGFRPRR